MNLPTHIVMSFSDFDLMNFIFTHLFGVIIIETHKDLVRSDLIFTYNDQGNVEEGQRENGIKISTL